MAARMIDRSSPSHSLNGNFPARDERKIESEAARFASRIKHAALASRLPTLADGSPPPASAHPIPDQAKIFNADGFFAAAQSIPSAAHLVSMPEVDSANQNADLLTRTLEREGAPLVLGLQSVHGSRSPAAAGTAPALGLDKIPVNPPDTARPAGALVEALMELSPSVEAHLMPTKAERTPLRTTGAQSMLRIAIRDVERGLQILVAGQALSTEERERLTNEIAALLSRHGLVPCDIRVAGPARFDQSGKR